MIKGVVFDLDHTLFDRYATFEECAPLWYERFQKYMAPGLGIEDVIVTMTYADKNYNHFGWGTVLQYLNESGFFREPMELYEYEEYIYEGFSKFAVPFTFTDALFEKLWDMDLKIGLITNGSEEVQQAKLKMLGFERKFDEIIICSTPEMRKPKTLPFEIMSQKLGIAPNELMYVGDHPKNDVDASRRAGYTPVWVRTSGIWGYKDIEKCEYQVDTVAEIPEIVKKLND
ncbi:MAG: HAD family hydrolase [Clostridia bacterium]|nr:HAD family hydrolase [Clostridia bacterium]